MQDTMRTYLERVKVCLTKKAGLLQKEIERIDKVLNNAKPDAEL